MAITLPKKGDTFEVIVSFDSSIDYERTTEEDWAEYQKNYNDDVLYFKEGEEPTIFVMRKVLPYELKKRVDSEERKVVGGDMQYDFGAQSLEVSAALVDIKNPANIPEDQKIVFKRQGDGTVVKDLMELLMATGIVQELWLARKVMMKDPTVSLKKK